MAAQKLTESRYNWKEFGLLTVAGVAGAVAVIPYTLALEASQIPEVLARIHMLLPVLLTLQMIQNAVLIAALVGLGLLAARHVGLGAPIIEGYLGGKRDWTGLKSILLASVVAGIIVALALAGLDAGLGKWHAAAALPNTPNPAPWRGLLASLYGGITEELMLRLGLFSMVTWLLGRLSRNAEGRPGVAILWAANIVTAVLFGLGHLPAAAQIAPLTAFMVARVVLLNGLAGLVFGYLYWTRGLESAMLAHFSGDTILHGLLPVFLP